MPEDTQQNETARRQLLKALATGGGAVAGSVLLPHRWARPLIKSVVLPAHAQTTNVVLNCNAGSLTVNNRDGGRQIAILYDGASTCSLLQLPAGADLGGASLNPDEILLLDPDGDFVTDWDLNGPNFGANWGPLLPIGILLDLGQGFFTFNRQRIAPPNAGVIVAVSFTISWVGNFFTVTNVQINTL